MNAVDHEAMADAVGALADAAKQLLNTWEVIGLPGDYVTPPVFPFHASLEDTVANLYEWAEREALAAKGATA
jgi:hypothetical protein